jgi:hypothetical protein
VLYRLESAIAGFALLERFAENANVPMADLRSRDARTRANARMRVSVEMGADIPVGLKNFVLDCERERHTSVHPTTAQLRLLAQEFDLIESTLLGTRVSPSQPGMAQWYALTRHL